MICDSVWCVLVEERVEAAGFKNTGLMLKVLEGSGASIANKGNEIQPGERLYCFIFRRTRERT